MTATQSARQNKPNIVFVLLDNIGWGTFGVYGGTIPTPRIDKFASEGIRFNNYNVEAQCTPTRSALLTGRHPVRSGTLRVPYPGGEGESGLAPWDTPSPNSSPTPTMPPQCTASGTWATKRAACRTIKASTSGGGSRTAVMRPVIPRGHCSRRAACRCP